jgi:hypothetical protein
MSYSQMKNNQIKNSRIQNKRSFSKSTKAYELFVEMLELVKDILVS